VRETVFENLAISSQHSAFSAPKSACNPLPTGHLEGEKGLTLSLIPPAKNAKKGLRLSYDCLVEWHLSLCLQQQCLWGVGVWLKDAGRGLQESPESRVIAVIARNRKAKITTTALKPTPNWG
jgi:hypothetical protein